MKTADARAARVALVWMAWKVGRNYADHIGQDHDDAKNKGKSGTEGRAACARHVINLTATELATLAVAGAVTGIRLSPWRVAVAIVADSGLHYVFDRRAPFGRLMKALGNEKFYEAGDPHVAPCGTGAYVMDQAAHDLVGFITALYAGR